MSERKTIYLDDAIDIVEFESGGWIGLAKTITDGLKQLPSAEPEIIRCKDCAWSDYSAWSDHSGNNSIYCANNGAYWNEEDYCNHAERRSDESDSRRIS